jgi:hypothetical protein
MMSLIIKLVSIWGILDSFWLASRPKDWGQMWSRAVTFISEHKALARALAGLQLSICIWLLRKK